MATISIELTDFQLGRCSARIAHSFFTWSQWGSCQARCWSHLKQWLSTGVILPSPQGDLVNVWNHFWLSQLVWGCSWHLVGRGQDVTQHPIIHRAPPPLTKIIPPKMSVVPRMRNPDIRTCWLECLLLDSLRSMGGLISLSYDLSNVVSAVLVDWC